MGWDTRHGGIHEGQVRSTERCKDPEEKEESEKTSDVMPRSLSLLSVSSSSNWSSFHLSTSAPGWCLVPNLMREPPNAKKTRQVPLQEQMMMNLLCHGIPIKLNIATHNTKKKHRIRNNNAINSC